ncbi:Gpi16 subunit GPI transamidase component [Flagelloscypha sp. PMI_526]|nr:Gpi16 subunit GPI transamidase component [Flagelloscypha sp. PMI_526]
MYSFLVPLLLLWPVVIATSNKEEFHERLTLRHLRDGKVASHFEFRMKLGQTLPRDPSSLDSEDYSQHYRVFPLTLGQILRQYSVSELHLSLNAGKWNYDDWNYPDELAVGAGAELYAWLPSSSDVDTRWNAIRNSLSGLFCASLSSLSSSQSLPPACLHRESYAVPKLLPCKAFSGIASLLNPHKLFDSDWHGMGVHVSWNPGEDGLGEVEIKLTFLAVLDPIRSQISDVIKDWRLATLFGRSISKASPIRVQLPVTEPYSISPEPHSIVDGIASYDTRNIAEGFDVGLGYAGLFEYPLNRPPLVPVSIRRTLSGTTQDRGQLSILLNNHLNEEIKIRWLETMPWFATFYLHTIQTTVNGHKTNGLVSQITYFPSRLHSDPSTLQATLTLPANATTHLTMDLVKGFLRYTEHRPDAQRGWDLPGAVFTPVGHNSSIFRKTYTPPLLIDLATPDFSMPYNVIIFSCSLIAFLFGSIFNELTRKFVVIKLDPSQL